MLAARTMYLANSFVWGTLFYTMVTVSMVYQVETVGLNPLQLVLVGTALEVSAFLFEVPTGMVADTYSRKLSVVLSFVITGFAFLLMGSVPSFIALIAGSFLWGIGWTFISGAHQAWLADEIGETDAAATYLVGARFSNIGAFLGIAIAVTLGTQMINLPFLVAGALMIVWGFVIVVCMHEGEFVKTEASGFKAMAGTIKEGLLVIRGSSTLILLMIVGVVIGTFSEGYDRLAAAHLLRGFDVLTTTGLTAVMLFGALTASGVLLSTLAVYVAERFVDTDSARQLSRTLSLTTVFIIASVLVFALSGQIWLALATYVLLQPLRALVDPLTMAWINRNLPSSSRATIISLHSQSDALGQMAGGPTVGLIGREMGVRFAITVAALLLTPAIWLYGRASRVPIATKDQ